MSELENLRKSLQALGDLFGEFAATYKADGYDYDDPWLKGLHRGKAGAFSLAAEAVREMVKDIEAKEKELAGGKCEWVNT